MGALAEEMPRQISRRVSYSTEWHSVWAQDGRRPGQPITRWPLWLRAQVGKPGVYFIRCSKCKRVLYVGRGKCVKRALTFHFRSFQREDHHRVYFNREHVEAKVYIVRREWLVRTEYDLIRKHDPPHNVSEREPGCDVDAEHVCAPSSVKVTDVSEVPF